MEADVLVKGSAPQQWLNSNYRDVLFISYFHLFVTLTDKNVNNLVIPTSCYASICLPSLCYIFYEQITSFLSGWWKLLPRRLLSTITQINIFFILHVNKLFVYFHKTAEVKLTQLVHFLSYRYYYYYYYLFIIVC